MSELSERKKAAAARIEKDRTYDTLGRPSGHFPPTLEEIGALREYQERLQKKKKNPREVWKTHLFDSNGKLKSTEEHESLTLARRSGMNWQLLKRGNSYSVTSAKSNPRWSQIEKVGNPPYNFAITTPNGRTLLGYTRTMDQAEKLAEKLANKYRTTMEIREN